ncbi:unnamed protein product [Paramecium primaurelia]|uniref:Uncharacterized protein n=1 Tax=Paramecium primaurelia TaxID=5886 RepID=A0A8S1MY86_PARPR|nr:unnamed protein product [Paramecium primaurelia]
MQTLRHYEAMAEEVRKIMLSGKPIPPDYQEVIEEFLPTEDKYPSRRVITLYEYPDSNPALFLENKRGFRLQFMFLFLSNELAAQFYEDVMNNGPLKWQIARFYLEVAENMVFIKTRGQRAQNMLQKVQHGIQTQPLCVFHYNLKMRTLLHILEQGNWCIRVVWGPAVDVPLHGGDEEKVENVIAKTEPKLEIQKKEEMEQEIIKKVQINEEEVKSKTSLFIKPIEYYSRLAQQTVQKLRDQNQNKKA